VRNNLFNWKKFIYMNISTKKWLFIKCSSLALIPLMIWFALNLVKIFNSDYDGLRMFFSSQPSQSLFSLFVVFSLFFYSLTVSEIFEDYINNKKIKNVANIVLYLFAIIISVITIITSLNF